MLLLQITCDCGGSFDLVDKKTKGVQLHYIMQCRKCSGFRSFKTCEDGLVDAVVDGGVVKGLSRDNLRIVLLALIGGLTLLRGHFERVHRKKERHSTRKKSLPFKMREKELSQKKIELNINARQVLIYSRYLLLIH